MRMVRFGWILPLIFGVFAGTSVVAPSLAGELGKASSSETLEEINKQLESNPLSEDLLRKKAALLFKDKEYQAVIATVKPLLIQNTKNPFALEATAKSYSRLREYGLALGFLNRLIDICPTYENIILRGSCRIRVGLYHEALRDNEWCMKLCPGDGRSYIQRAEIHRSLVGVDEQFERYLNKAIELSPNDPAVKLDYAIASKLIREKKKVTVMTE